MGSTDEQSTDPISDRYQDATDLSESEPTAESGELAEQLEAVRAENRRLREEYARAKRVQYRRSALGLLAVGLICVGAGIVFPSERTVLFALGATGIFGAILTNFLSPEALVPTDVTWSIYDAVATTGSGIRDELGLADVSVYVPVESSNDELRAPVRLFIPQSTEFDVPAEGDLRSTFVAATDDRRRGVSVTPTAARLIAEFERTQPAEPVDDPEALAAQLCDALVEQFELARSASADAETDTERVTFRVGKCAQSPITSFDHPVVSLVGTGFAWGLERSIRVEVEEVTDGAGEFLVTCRW